MNAVEKAQKKLSDTQAEIQSIAERQQQIEALLAEKWGADNSAIEDEYVRNSAKLNAGQQVIERLKEAVKDARKTDALALQESARADLATTAKQLTDADQKLLKAFEKLMAGLVAAWVEADLAHDAADRAIRGANYKCDQVGVQMEEINEIAMRHEYELQAKCRALVQALQNVGTPGEVSAFQGITRDQVAHWWANNV